MIKVINKNTKFTKIIEMTSYEENIKDLRNNEFVEIEKKHLYI